MVKYGLKFHFDAISITYNIDLENTNKELIHELSHQILIHDEQAETELLWVPSNWSRIPYGAIVAGHKPDGGPLYVAQIHRYDRWWAGNYDPDKPCAEYLLFYGPSPVIFCDEVWKLLVVKYGRFKKMWANHNCYRFFIKGIM